MFGFGCGAKHSRAVVRGRGNEQRYMNCRVIEEDTTTLVLITGSRQRRSAIRGHRIVLVGIADVHSTFVETR